MERFTFVFEPAEEGGYTAYVAEVPGANSQGETIEQARGLLMEALHELLDYRREKAKASAATGAIYEEVLLAG